MFSLCQNDENMMRNIILTTVLLLLGTGNIVAQEVMSMKECMEYAVDNAIKVKLDEIEIDDACLARRDAILSAFTPSVSASSSANMSFGRSIDPETNTYVPRANFGNSYSASGGIYLFNGFSAVNNMKISKTAISMGIDQEQLTKDELCLAVMQAYCNVIFYHQLCGALEDQVETANNALTLAVRQEEFGSKGLADVVGMEAELADREFMLVNAQNNRYDAMLTLKDLMFWPMDQELLIDTSLADNDAMTILYHEEKVEDIIYKAQSNNPSANIARGKMETAKIELNTARWDFAPRLYLSGGWSSSYYTYPGQKDYVPLPFWRQILNNQGEYIGLSLSIPIYDGLSRHSNLRRKKNAYTRAELEYTQKMRDIEAEVKRAVQDRDGAAASFRQAERRAEVQEEAYRLNMRKFEQGLISPIDFQKASDSWLDAKASRVDALLKFYIKRSVVNYYNGVHYLAQ